MILTTIKGYVVQAAIAGLALALVALVVVWLQARALRAENETLQITAANLRTSLETSERQLAEARKDVQRLDAILLERDNARSTIARQFQEIRHDLRIALSAAGEEVRRCLAVRLPAAVVDRLRARPGDGDADGVRPAPGDAGTGLPGAGPEH